MFSTEQIRKYAEHVFVGHRFTDRPHQRLKCPIHDGRDKNFALDMNRGVWTCHSRCGSGGLVQLEQRLHGGTREEATERVFRLVGVPPEYQGKQLVCTYDYTDAAGKLAYQKVRLEPKDFRFRVPVGDRAYRYGALPEKRYLYGLLGVLTANCICICEGEKDADTLNSIREWPAGTIGSVYATTAGAAGSWKPEFATFMAGKRVLVFEDNDEKGRESGEAIASSCYPLAQSVRVVRFEDMPEKSDVTDFLNARGLEALLERIRTSKPWAPPAEAEEPSTIVEGMAFATSGSTETDWLIEGVLQADGNGIIMGDPKAGKSLMTMHMIVHLISGTPWFGCNVKRRVRVGLVTREDAPGLTKKRMLRMLKGSPLATYELDNWLWVNSREQTKTFDIQNERDFSTLVRDFRKQRCEIVFFDVFNRLHKLNENDNQQMSEITARLSQFGAEVGCQIGLVHHINKDTGDANVFNRLRGAGALHGWMEWGLAVTVKESGDDESQWIRRVDLESKDVSTAPFHYRIEDGPGFTLLNPCEPTASTRPTAFKVLKPHSNQNQDRRAAAAGR